MFHSANENSEGSHQPMSSVHLAKPSKWRDSRLPWTSIAPAIQIIFLTLPASSGFFVKISWIGVAPATYISVMDASGACAEIKA